LDTTSEKVPDPTLQVHYQKSVHNMSHSTDVLDYNNDSGQWVSLPGSLQQRDNPVALNPATLADEQLAYGTGENTTLDAGNYTLSGTTSKASLGDAADTGALQFDASNLSTGDSVTATYTLDSAISSDVGKRVFWAAGNVQELNGTAQIELVDGDGDTVTYTLNGTSATSEAQVFAGDVGIHTAQQKVMDLTVSGSGDGTLDSISKVRIVAMDGAVDMDLSTLTFERMTRTPYGTMATDTDGDNVTEDVDVYEPQGMTEIKSLSTMPALFDDATLWNIDFYYEEDGEEGDLQYEFDTDAGDEYNTHAVFKSFWSYDLPESSELTPLSSSIETTVVFPTTRLVDAWYVGNAGDSSYAELDNSSAQNDLTTDFENAGDNATTTITSGLSEGQRVVIYQAWTVDEDDKNAMTSSGGIGVPLDTGSLWGYIMGLPGAIIGAIGVYGAFFRGWVGSFVGMVKGLVGKLSG
jgi:hypothetical protein